MRFPKGVLRHPINKKALGGCSRTLPPIMVSIWDFGAKHPQSERRLYGDHPCPAKMRPDLSRAILQIYGEEPVLDPMCGSGTTNISSSLLGMENYGIDIEKSYIEILKQNLRRLTKPLHGKMGETFVQLGDARELPFPDNSFRFILFSPPYWAAIQGNRGSWGMYDSKKIRRRNKYSDNPQNIGNVKAYEDYLTEMLKVYRECYRVLEKQKLMVVVTKDINRNYLTVPIGADTIKTCQKAGFKLFDIIINKMYFPAYWMVHYYVKQQENGIMRALTVHEYVLIFKK